MDNVLKYLNIRVVLCIGFLAHIPMLWNGFTYYSDDVYVLDNPLVHTLSGESVKTIFSTYFDGHYHPLTLLSLALTYLLCGDHAIGYQLTNLCFHLASCYLVYKTFKELKLSETVVLIAALVFAIHPLTTESVSRITERKDTQYVLFLLLALYQYARFYNTAKINHYYISVLCFLLSILSKGQAFVFPFILYAVEWFLSRQKQKPFHHIYILPLFAVSGLFAYLNYRAQLVTGYLSETERVSLMQVVTYPSYIISHYVFKLFVPVQLSAQYPAPVLNGLMWLYPLVLMALLALLVWLYRKQYWVLLLGCLFYIVSVFPMLRLVPVSENFMPDRYNYLGLVGFGLVAGDLLTRLLAAKKAPYLKNIMALWLLALAVLCFSRTMVWKSGISIWSDAYAKYPGDPYATSNYGNYLARLGGSKSQEGLALMKKSTEQNPDLLVHRINYAKMLNALGSKEVYMEEMSKVMSYPAKTADNMGNKGSILLAFGRPAEALAEYNKAIILKPCYAKNRINRAGYYYNQFEFEKALYELDTLESLHSNYSEIIWMLRADIYLAQEKPAAAQEAFEHARRTGTSKDKLKGLGGRIAALQNSPPIPDITQLSFEQLSALGKSRYDNGLFYQGWRLFAEAHKKQPANEAILNNLMASAYNLSRPELMKQYMDEIRKYNYAVRPEAQAYLRSLGIE